VGVCDTVDVCNTKGVCHTPLQDHSVDTVSKKYLLLSTVRPETIFGDTAVAVNPNDERYKNLIGKKVRVPLTSRYIPIIADDYADPKFGTGCVKITPAHDPNDFLVGERHNLETIQTINPDGTLNELTGEFNGLERFDARKKILTKLQDQNYVEKIENYTHNVGVSERGGEPIEPYLSDQWFVKMQPLVDETLRAVVDGEIKFYPSHWVKTYSHWMKNIRDWCISRQLWWGHRIPVYYTVEKNPVDVKFTAAKNEKEARKKLNLSADTVLKQDEDSLDTWFSSWLWPLTTMGWMGDNKTEKNDDLKKFLPTDLLVTAPEIIFFWVARMIIATKKFKQEIPFKNVYFTSIIRDGQGRKLSKSLGNSPDPLNIIAKYGADAVRFSMVYLAPLGQDVRMDVDIANQDISSMEIGRNFANKIWNAGRFLSMKFEEADAIPWDFKADNSFEYSLADWWIASRLYSTIEKLTTALDEYKLTEYSKIIYDFIWRDFCDWYIEILKVQINSNSQAKGGGNSNKKLTNFAVCIFNNAMQLLHPIMPFITEEIFELLNYSDEERTILTTEFPELMKKFINEKIEKQFELVQNIVEEVRKLRASLNIPTQKLPAVISTKDKKSLEIFIDLEDVLKNLCKFSELKIGKNLAKPDGATSTVYREIEVSLVVEGAIDKEAEKQRIDKEIARLEGNIRACESKLNNEKFISGASPEIITREREKLVSMQESLKKLQANA
jgi:valyl-tRNA synthetase